MLLIINKEKELMKKILLALLCTAFLFGCSTSKSGPKAENGDVVKIDFVGKLNGTAFQGGSASGYILELGSGTFIPGFEEQIVDMYVDDKETIDVTFPESYGSSELAGKATTFDITLHKIYRESENLKSQNGDVVKIDFVGKLNGTAFQGGTGAGYNLELGSGTFIPGFEEQLVDMKAGDAKTINVTFPENYGSSDLAGKDVTFDVTVNHIFREVK